jgi:Transcriptional regulators
MLVMPETITKKVNKNLLAGQIYDVLFELLIKNELPPGTKLNIDGISKQLGVSRSPVASAFNALERDGFLKIVPQNGTFVRDLTSEELDAIYMTRAALERIVVPFAMKKAESEFLESFRKRFEKLKNRNGAAEKDLLTFFDMDVELHQYFASFLPEIVRREYTIISNLTFRSRLLKLKHESKGSDVEKIITKDVIIHVDIIDAFLARDEERAAKLLEEDVTKAKNEILKFLF